MSIKKHIAVANSETFKEGEELHDLVEDIYSPDSRGIIIEIFCQVDHKIARVKWIKHQESTNPYLPVVGCWLEDCYNLKLISSGKTNETQNN